MSRDGQYLMDILDAARLARSFIADVTKEAFVHDTQRQDCRC